MVFKVAIKDNKNTPINYLPDLDSFKNGKEYLFTSGVNVIVGENGCGKTTLMNLIKKYLLVDFNECSKGRYNCNINALYNGAMSTDFRGGVDVYADYKRNTFRLSHAGEKETNDAVETFTEFGTMFEQKTASTGEGVIIALSSLFGYMFSKDAKLLFDYDQFKDDCYPEYGEYIKKHQRIGKDEWTILMDEPDRNLSLENLEQIKGILNFHKEGAQVIAVIHNPLLIYNLSNNKEVNIIQMTKGYVDKVKGMVDDLVK